MTASPQVSEHGSGVRSGIGRLSGVTAWPTPPRTGGQSSTAAARLQAVHRVVLALRTRFAEPLSLDELAAIAISSPFHFNRVFRQITGLPPCRFLSAIRLQAAKRLLVTTRRSVTSICFSVGYSSLGTFTTHFTQFVGMSPNRLRRMCSDARSVALLPGAAAPASGAGDVTVAGRIGAPSGFSGPAMIGLFETPIPRGRPLACTTAESTGAYELRGVPDGEYHLLAVGLEPSADLLTCCLGELPLRGRSGPIVVRGGVAAGPADVVLREPRLTDPPILVALPVLMAEHAARTV